MDLTLKDIVPDINSEEFEVEYDEKIASLLEPDFSSIPEEIQLEELINRFNIEVVCNDNILQLTFLDEFSNYTRDEYNRHRIYGQDDYALYEIFIDEKDDHNFLEYHITRLDHGPSLIYRYNKKGEIIFMT